eukprot:maker-scaffold1792_size27886-snap-gene-0.4 protein:Tk04214 transcript:maker-scaffold1792_size27886-snap-gene-0.4-mRNA-1 annotation:"zinc transporter zip1"
MWNKFSALREASSKRMTSNSKSNQKPNNAMDLLAVKIITMALLGGVSLLLGLVPMAFRSCMNKRPDGKSSKMDLFISAFSCFGGGVILTTCLTHMLPEVNLFLQNNIKQGDFPDTGMPIAEILVLCGFMMIYIVEEITHSCIHLSQRTKEKKRVKRAMNPLNAEEDGEWEPCVQQHGHTEIPTDIIVPGENQGFEATLRGFLVILALSLHAVFEGIALGLTHTVSSVWFLFFAIASHKYVISFCIGMQFVSSGIKPLLNVIYVATFALISPLGAGLGILLSESVTSEASLQNSLVTILQGLATGTLLYVVFFEVIEKERTNGTNGILQVVFISLGFICMILLELVEVKATGGDPVVQSLSIDDGKDGCPLLKFDDQWSLPMNFTCVSGELQPTPAP